MTRGIVQVKAGDDTVTLYSRSDSYPTGLGRDLLAFTRRCPEADRGVNDYAMRLLRGDLGLEFNINWANEALDWVYLITIGTDGRLALTAQEVAWGTDDKRPQLERLSEPIDIAETIRKSDEEAEAYRKQREALLASIKRCPYCNGEASPIHVVHGVKIACQDFFCRRHPAGPVRASVEEAIAAWNQWVATVI